VNNRVEHKAFIFNDKIDKELLFSLYEDDFPYIEEIFSITLSQVKPDIAALKTAFASAQIDELRRAAHKLKPSFGFVGLPLMQEQCKQFEDKCSVGIQTNSLVKEYGELLSSLEEHVQIIESEYQKLKEYNQP
jgi:HPt (histidine-containing phosphotransfer) domain-containing protein